MKSEFFNHNSKPSYALMSTISGHDLVMCTVHTNSYKALVLHQWMVVQVVIDMNHIL